MRNLTDTIINQYASSARLRRIIDSMNEAIDPAQNIDAFYNLIWNLDTAQGYGLDVWGRIVGVGRVLQIAASKYLGFDEATPISADPFNQSPWYSGQQINSNFVLADPGFRTLIFAKALANICDGSVSAINQILLTLFPNRGNVYVQDNLDMSLVYTFHFAPTPVEVAIVANSGVLPRPSGVATSMVVV